MAEIDFSAKESDKKNAKPILFVMNIFAENRTYLINNNRFVN